MDDKAVLMMLARKEAAYYGITQRTDVDAWVYFLRGKALTYDILREETRLWYATETYRQLAQGMRV